MTMWKAHASCMRGKTLVEMLPLDWAAQSTQTPRISWLKPARQIYSLRWLLLLTTICGTPW
jgi:hypothetical protein